MEEAMRRAHLNILMVEDNLVNQKVLRKQLQNVGCHVHVAGNGVEALEWLQASVHWRGERQEELSSNSKQMANIDIILMDIEMPIMDGLTCARQIRDYEQQGLLTTRRTHPQRQISSSSISPTSSLRGPCISNDTVDKATRKSRLPILAVSANARNEQVQQALAAGVDDAIAKPFRIPELWPKMEALVMRRYNGNICTR
jgi:CheY-like chemotaxis protein